MNRIKIILGYILGFISASLISVLSLLLIVKFTIYNKDYIKNNLQKNNYYQKVSNEILDNMKNYMMSSGLPETVLDGIYTDVEITKDINKYIDNMYQGRSAKIDLDVVKNRLQANIDKYLNDHKVKITSKEYINSFVNDIGRIYEKEVSLYGYLNGVMSTFKKGENLVNNAILVTSIIVLVLIIILILIKQYLIGSIISASGLILLFIRFLIYDKIDINNILIISSEFSLIIKKICNEILNNAFIISLLLIIIGVTLIISKSFNKKTLKKD